MSRYLAVQQADDLLNDLVKIHQLPLGSALLKEQADPADDFRGARSALDDSHGSVARLFHIWSVASQPAQASIRVGDGGGNRLIHLVRQGGSQLPHGGHATDVCEIRLGLT